MLDPIMIFVFDFGVKGVALASFLAQLSMVAYFIYIDGITYRVEYTHRVTPILWKIYREFLSVGMAQMLMQLIIAVGIVIYNFYRQAGRKRDGSVYAHWSHRLFHHHADAGYRDRVADCGGAKLGTRKCHPHAECLLGRRRAGLLYCAGVSRYAYCTGTWMYPLFTRVVAVSDYAVLQTRIMALALPFVAISLLASEYYQAIGKPWYSVLLTLMRHVFISVPVVYLLAIVLEMRITGVYFGAMSGTFVAALLAWRLLRLSPRLLRWNQEAVRSQHLDMEVAP